jgi:hypothetical protein
MDENELRVGEARLDFGSAAPEGSYDDAGGEPRFRIANYDAMPPFLMSLVSDGDLWLFLSSSGALTAGRRDPDRALFPYYTDDRIHDGADQTGGKTVLRVTRGGPRGASTYLWEPFSTRYAGLYRITRTLSKSAYGNEAEFEERNADLGLAFSYSWAASGRYGFVRSSRLVNEGGAELRVEVLDGLLNVMPSDLTRRFQADFSTLADAYRDSELVEAGASSLALYRLSSVPTDRAEPCESLRATTVWSEGLDPDLVLLCASQLDAFRRGSPLSPETRVRGRRGAYLARSAFLLPAGGERSWLTVADVGADAARVAFLRGAIARGSSPSSGARSLGADAREDAAASARNLRRIVATVDGLQLTGDSLRSWRHYSNALFNAMRGGLPDSGYAVSASDFASFVAGASAAVSSREAGFLSALPSELSRDELAERARATGDPDLERLAREYMPLTFSRRHGDPSRPWNSFTIATRDERGRRILGYEGNWRDIFQNWEALSLSYPGYIDSMLFKFLDSTTADGYNPYRITRDGFEWEVIDENDSWSFIGYWGDHQAAYLLRLLEASARYRPGELAALLGRPLFPYAQLPYRIKDYRSMLATPKSTVDFDAELHRWILERAKTMGADGKLLRDGSGSPYRACLAEKLLVAILAKLSNYVPDAGIWMNTQRPEWNDANNALVGYGLSVVTLCYLRNLVAFSRALFAEAPGESFELSVEVLRLARRVGAAFGRCGPPVAPSGLRSPEDRGKTMDELGEAGSDYRLGLYERGLAGPREKAGADELVALCDIVVRDLDRSLRANRRPDGLYHAYNLMQREGGRVEIRRLPAMLEGQVAVLSSGILEPEEAAALLEALRASDLYRPDQASYLLYPDRLLPAFLEKNKIPRELAEGSPLAMALLERGDSRLILRDGEGDYHFSSGLHNARDLEAVLDSIEESESRSAGPGGLGDLARDGRQGLLDLYEKVFDHHSFTGRSGTFYKYEGLGSIYWHMVSKLLLAVGETSARARKTGADEGVLSRLDSAYREIREGLGTHKTPAAYGAFPTDPYSHTPSFAGAQQPGMTGQVKEDLISRFGELGASVEGGRLSFRPSFAARDEFLRESREFRYVDASDEEARALVGEGCYAFTICQVLVVAHRGEVARSGPSEAAPRMEIHRSDGSTSTVRGLELGEAESASIFGRDLAVERLDLFFGSA